MRGRGYVRCCTWNGGNGGGGDGGGGGNNGGEGDGSGGNGNGGWEQSGESITGRNEGDGMYAISMTADGTTLAAGTIFGGYVEVVDWDGASLRWIPRRGGDSGNDDGGGDDDGRDDDDDNEGPSLSAPNGEADFGTPLSISSSTGTVLAVDSEYVAAEHSGGPTEASTLGMRTKTADAHLLYVFEWTPGANERDSDAAKRRRRGRWTRRDRLSGLADRVGGSYSVSLSSDGSILAAGMATGVILLEWDPKARRYVGQGETDNDDGKGRTIGALSADGTTVAVGRPEWGGMMGRTTVHERGNRRG